MNKSPMNYIGGKYKLLPQILPLFPQNINTFVDMFAGGLDVSLNVRANNIICNDINNYVIGIYEEMKQHQIDDLLQNIQDIILAYNLSKTNKDGYVTLRRNYNETRNPLELFVLVCYGFNHQFRFNNKGEFNNSFGVNRSSYNQQIENNLRNLHEKIHTMTFSANNFRQMNLQQLQAGDFVYADPPYRISCGSYNDGKRVFEGWSEQDDLALLEILDELNERNIHFALSNVIEHKGQQNILLNEWRQRYHTNFLNANYSNSNYQCKDKETRTVEVLITNY